MRFYNNSTALLSFLFALTLCGWLYKNSSSIKSRSTETEDKDRYRSKQAEGDNAEWQEYEIMRMADPSTGRIPNGIRMKELAFGSTLPKNTDAGYTGRLRGSSGFINRGPWNVGGRTRAFAMDVANHNILIAGSTSGDIFRSTDAGATWTSVTSLTALKGITCISQDTRAGHTNTWYAGTGEAYGQSAGGNGSYYFGNGVLKSTDDGLTWNALDGTTTANNYALNNFFELVWNVKTDPSNTSNDVVYAATYGNINRSQDGGTTWKTILASNGISNSYFTDVAVTSTGVVYATLSDDGSSKGIWRSADGINFTNIMPVDKVVSKDTFPHYNRMVIGIDPSDENTVYILANTPGTGMPDTNFLGDVQWNSLWRYHYNKGNGADTAGGTWMDLSSHIPHKGTSFDMFDVQGSYNMVVAVKPDDSNTVFIACTNIFRSTNGFKDDNQITKIGGYGLHATLPVVAQWANHHPDEHVLFFDPSNPNVLYNGGDGGLFKTTNCLADTVKWQTFDHGYLTSMFYSVAIDHGTPNDPVIVGGLQDNGSWFTNSTDPTRNWVRPGGADGGYCAIADGKTAYYLSQDMGKTFKMTLDANGSVAAFARIDTRVDSPGYLFVTPLVLDPTDQSKMYFGAGSRLWRNNDLSTIPLAGNYDSISTNWISFTDTVASGKISSIACSTQPAHTLYYGTTNAKVYKVVNANTGSPTRKDITGSTFPKGSCFVSCVAVDPENADNLFVVFSNYGVYALFYSNDGGTTWSRIEGNLLADGGTGGPSFRWATFAHLADGHTAYFLATSIGLFATDTINGAKTTWVQQGADVIGNEVCNMIDYRASDGLLAVATHSKGIFSANISSLNDIATVKDIKEQSASLNNFPNPFNGETTIAYTLQKPAYITLTVYDLIGRVVSQLTNNTWMSEGKHSIPFNSKQLPAGMYLCRLQASGIDETIRMVSNK